MCDADAGILDDELDRVLASFIIVEIWAFLDGEADLSMVASFPVLPIRRRIQQSSRAAPTVGLKDITYTEAGNVALRRLHQQSQKTCHYGIRYMEGWTLSIHSFPDDQTNKKLEFLADCLRIAAEQIGASEELRDALDTDADFLYVNHT